MAPNDKFEGSDRPINSTDMFLRSFDSPPAEQVKPDEEITGGERSWPPNAMQSTSSRPVTDTVPQDAPGASGGEFTRLFVRPTPSGEHERLTPLPTAQHPVSASNSLRSATPEDRDFGSPTSNFQSVPPSPTSLSTRNSSQYFSREVIRAPSQPASAKVEELRRSLADEQRYSPEQARSQHSWSTGSSGSAPQSPAQSIQTQPPEYASSTPAGNSVTVMLDRLALEEARSSALRKISLPPTAPPIEQALPTVPSGPGEFTRVINRLEMGSAPLQAVTPAVAPQSPVTPLIPIHAVPTPATMPLPVAMAMPVAPRVEPLKLPTPPAVAAQAVPKSKLQEMLPLLLIANAFLMVLLIVVVVFALRAKS